MAIPIPSAPRIAGTGFSRTKTSVRSRARPAFSFVPSHVWLIAVETLFVARRNCSRPVEPISCSLGCGAESGASLVRSFSFGLIIQKEIVWRGGIASLFCSRFATKRSAGVPWSARNALHTGKRLQQSSIRLVNIFAPKNKDHSLDLVGVREEFSRGFYGHLRCFQNWIAVGAAADRWKRDGFDTVLDRDLQ